MPAQLSLTALYQAGDPNHHAKPAEQAAMAVIEAIYAALISGDQQTVADLLLPDATFTITGFPGMEGQWHGPEAILSATADNLSQLAPDQLVFEHVIAQGDQVAIRFREQGTHLPTQRRYEASAVHWFHFQQDRVASLTAVGSMKFPTAD